MQLIIFICDEMRRVAFYYTGPEMCAANSDNCQVDKISEMVANGDCLEYHCADGYIGEDCNSKYYRASTPLLAAVHVAVIRILPH